MSITQQLRPDETQIVGAWIFSPRGMEGDVHTQRIHWLVEHALEHVAFSPVSGAWETLFRDPADGRLWERTFPQSERHGGGPPALLLLTAEEAASKYRLADL